jgi:hypothetical protein
MIMYLRGQGATEYLVLLAVVLIVALVSVALLGFFPGMASDAQETQSKTYWQSASPIAITEWGARYANGGVSPGYTHVYMKIRNTGAYPLRLSKLLANGRSLTERCTGAWNCGYGNFSDIYLYPGEEKLFGHPDYIPGIPDPGWNSSLRNFFVLDFQMPGAVSANCSRSAPYGTAVVNNFGFEYIQYVEGQQLTKRQIGAKPVVIKCRNNFD